MELLLYLDQNYLSGIVKRKVAFRELEPTLRAAVACGAVAVPESEAHRLESAARPDLPLLPLLRELSVGLTLAHERGAVERYCERRLEAILERDFPERQSRASDRLDVRALAVALPRCRLVTLRHLHGRRRPPDRSRRALPLRALQRSPRGRRAASQTARALS